MMQGQKNMKLKALHFVRRVYW